MVVGAEDFRQLPKRKPKLECPLCKSDTLNGRWREHPVTTIGPQGRGKNAELLVMTERIGTDASKARQLSRAQRNAVHGTSMNPRMGSIVKHFVRCRNTWRDIFTV